MSCSVLFNKPAMSFSATPASPCGGVEEPHKNAVYSPFFIQVRRWRCRRAGGVGHLHPARPRAYSPPVGAHSPTGFGDPMRRRRNGAAMALFCCVAPSQFYGGRVGQASAWPGSYVPGSPTRHVRHPSRLATLGGGSSTRHRNQAHG